MKSKISSFFEKKSGKLALSGIIFALALVVALTTVFVLNGKKLENKTTPPTNAETTIVPNNSDNWTNAGNYDTVNISTGAGFTDGNGTEADPYIITTARQLAGLSYLASTGGIKTYKYYKLGGDINLLDHYWTPIGIDYNHHFNGSFDGDGYVISGMVVSGSFSHAGLFGYMKEETGRTLKISNLGIENSEIKTTSSSSYVYAGGLVGYAPYSLTIENSYNNGLVSAESTSSYDVYAGGLVGYFSSTSIITNSYNTGNVSAESTSFNAHAGGLVGYFSSLTIENSYNTGDVSATSSSGATAGGLVGASSLTSKLTITNSYNTGSVSAGSTSSYGANAGGLVGASSSTSKLTFTNSYNIGNVSATSSSSARAGGLVGTYSSSLTITNSYNTGSVSADSTSYACAGGLVGNYFSSSSSSSSLTITNSYNIGGIDATGSTRYKGGLIGRLDFSGVKEINNSYFDGDVFSGNMIGNGSATITASGKVVGLSELMKDKNNYGTESFGTYTGDNSSTGSAVWSSESPWDFENVWGEDVFGTNNGYPVLRNEEYNDYFADIYWKYNAATSYAGGDGTQSSPYLISSAEELALLSNEVNSGKFYDQETGTDKYIYAQLIDDIDLSGKYWNLIGQLNVMDMSGYTFVGSFDGNGHEIMNLEYDTSSLGMFIGVFGFVGEKGPLMGGEFNENYSELKNLGISGNDIELIFPSSSQVNGIGIGVAGITSYAIHTKIEDCYNKANITVEGAQGTVAGIVGAMSGEVNNCYNNGDLTMNIDIGDVNNSYSANVGGIVGGGGLPSLNIDLISNCYNSGKLNAETSGYSMGFNVNIGGIAVGWAGEIKNSYNIGDIYGQSNASESTTSSLSLGGINASVGSGLSLAIYNSFNIGQITGSYSGGTNLPESWMSNMNAKGGILGWKTGSSNLIITNSYFDSDEFSGRLVGKADRNDSNNDGIYEDEYLISASGKVSELSEKMRDKANYNISSFGTYTDDNSATGDAVWSSENPWDFVSVWMIEQGFNFEYPIFQTMKARMWKYDDNVLAITGFSKGLGTAESPYQISSAEELAYLSNEVNSGKFYNTETKKTQYIYVELTADIDLSGKYWTPIGTDWNNYYFNGSLEGNGYVISGMTIDLQSSEKIYAGLFGCMRGETDQTSKISNLGIQSREINVTTSSSAQVGGLVGYYEGFSLIIENSYNTGSVSATSSSTSSSASAGGLVGECYLNDPSSFLTITNSYNTGSVSAISFDAACAGGLVAETHRSNTITNSYNTGSVTAISSSYTIYSGGLVGNSSSTLTITNSYNAGLVSANSTSPVFAGGLVGSGGSTLTIINSYNTGSVNVTSSYYLAYIGGLMGRMNYYYGSLTITSSFNSGKVSTNKSSAYVGGIAGSLMGTVTVNNTFCTGDIQSPTGSGDYIKPMFGNGTATITNSYYNLDMLNSSGGVASTQKNYYDKGSSDTVAFDGNIWFYHADLNEGFPLLRALFWAESSVAVQSDVYAKLTQLMAG